MGVQANPDEVPKMIEIAKELGWDGICLLCEKKDIKIVKEETKKYKNFDVGIGLIIESKSKNDLVRKVLSDRKDHEIIAVRSRSPEQTRIAMETRGVDIVLGWELCVSTSQKAVDHVMVKLSKESSASLAFSFSSLVHAYDRSRAGILAKMLEAAKFVSKYKTPFIVTSGALSAWDLRSPSELKAFAKVLGFSGKPLLESVSEARLAENRKRLSGKWIMPGVEKE